MSDYIYPIGKGLTFGRTDQGVDFGGRGQLAAIGDGVITRVSPQGSGTGWPGARGSGTGAMIVYRITSGPRRGQHVFLAENLDPAAGLRVGAKVKAGQILAHARGASPFIETGWSDAAGVPLAHPHYTEGKVTAEGSDFRSFLTGLKKGEGVDAGMHFDPTKKPPNLDGGGIAGDLLTAPSKLAASAGSKIAKEIVDALFDTLKGQGGYAALAGALVIGAVVLFGLGVKRTAGANQPARA